MTPDEAFTREIQRLPGHRLEVGAATLDDGDGTKLSVRHFIPNEAGRFDPHSSGEIPIEMIGPHG